MVPLSKSTLAYSRASVLTLLVKLREFQVIVEIREDFQQVHVGGEIQRSAITRYIPRRHNWRGQFIGFILYVTNISDFSLEILRIVGAGLGDQTVRLTVPLMTANRLMNREQVFQVSRPVNFGSSGWWLRLR